jgi:hypothetical protein|tara:strand:+ start:395 stop:604 length:210 start_codon:yes stop_codon:yes gene_type:complete
MTTERRFCAGSARGKAPAQRVSARRPRDVSWFVSFLSPRCDTNGRLAGSPDRSAVSVFIGHLKGAAIKY